MDEYQRTLEKELIKHKAEVLSYVIYYMDQNHALILLKFGKLSYEDNILIYITESTLF